MRKLLLATMAVVMVMGISRTAEAMTANQLLELCESPREEVLGCMGYMLGFLQGVTAANAARDLQNEQVCFPGKLTVPQLQKMFVKSTNENPEHLHREAGEFLYALTARPFAQSIAKGSCFDSLR